jgi:alkylated DNA repair dioxygenase AlkB
MAVMMELLVLLLVLLLVDNSFSINSIDISTISSSNDTSITDNNSSSSGSNDIDIDIDIGKICKDSDCSDIAKEFQRTGLFHIPNYLTNDEINAMLNEVHQLRHLSYYSTDSHTIYQDDIVSSLPINHTRNILQNSSKFIIGYDKLPSSSLLRSIYNRNNLINIVSKCVNINIFLSGCKYNSAYYNIYEEGDELGWHFDKSTFGVNLILQNAGNGGHFEYHHNHNNNDIYNYNNVNNIINNYNNNSHYYINNIDAGSLIIFAGRYSLHRVSKVTQLPARINAILSFEISPNVKSSPYTLKKFFGINEEL